MPSKARLPSLGTYPNKRTHLSRGQSCQESGDMFISKSRFNPGCISQEDGMIMKVWSRTTNKEALAPFYSYAVESSFIYNCSVKVSAKKELANVMLPNVGGNLLLALMYFQKSLKLKNSLTEYNELVYWYNGAVLGVRFSFPSYALHTFALHCQPLLHQ